MRNTGNEMPVQPESNETKFVRMAQATESGTFEVR